MEFRLFYEGPLPADTGSGARAKWKHKVRQFLHPQLRELWQQNKDLRNYGQATVENPNVTYLDLVANRFRSGQHRFVPLITHAAGYWCVLDVLFLRRDVPGNLFEHGGDMDNRLKTLFDALAIPRTTDGLPEEPADGERPMYCLLEDDRLITTLSVTTDRLLIPISAGGENSSNVKLVIHVRTTSFSAPPASTFLPG